MNIKHKFFLFKRKLILMMYPPIMSTRRGNYIRITRIANEGFNVKAYKTEFVYAHTERFIDVTVDEINAPVKSIDRSHYIIPGFDENLMIGCFCFFYLFNISQAEAKGNLPFRSSDKLNVAYLHESEIVWVKNVKESGKINERLIKITKESENPYTGEKSVFEDDWRRISDWVRMPLSLALQRTNKHKQTQKHIDENISQIYLVDKQINRLKSINQILFQIAEHHIK